MGAGPLSSDSKTSDSQQRAEGPVTATNGTALSVQQRGRSRNVAQGAISLEDGASVGGISLGKARIGKGANVTITTQGGNLDDIANELEQAVKDQADRTAAAFSSLGALTTPNAQNTQAGPDNTPLFAMAGAAVVALGLIALAIVFKK